MKSIIVKIEIIGIENWQPDWNNKQERDKELLKLSMDIKDTVAEYCGVEYNNMTVTSELITQ